VGLSTLRIHLVFTKNSGHDGVAVSNSNALGLLTAAHRHPSRYSRVAHERRADGASGPHLFSHQRMAVRDIEEYRISTEIRDKYLYSAILLPR
jgi:hypothetical protein